MLIGVYFYFVNYFIFNRILNFHYIVGSYIWDLVRQQNKTKQQNLNVAHKNTGQIFKITFNLKNNLFLTWPNLVKVMNALKFMGRNLVMGRNCWTLS